MMYFCEPFAQIGFEFPPLVAVERVPLQSCLSSARCKEADCVVCVQVPSPYVGGYNLISDSLA